MAQPNGGIKLIRVRVSGVSPGEPNLTLDLKVAIPPYVISGYEPIRVRVRVQPNGR